MELSGAHRPPRLALRPRITSRFMHVLPRDASRRLLILSTRKRSQSIYFFKVEKPHLPADLAGPGSGA